MNYFNIFLRMITAFITFAIGLALVGSPGTSSPQPKPVREQTRADALQAELEAMNAFYKKIEQDREAARLASEAAEETAKEASFQSSDSFQVRNSDYAPEGDFEIKLGNEGAFRNIESFYLIASEYRPEEGLTRSVSPRGAIYVSGEELEFNSIAVYPHSVAFTTKSDRGISYSFEGVVAIRFYEEDYGAIVIRGTLSKFLNGKRVVHDIVEFEEMEGC